MTREGGWSEQEALVTDSLARHDAALGRTNDVLGTHATKIALIESAAQRSEAGLKELEIKLETRLVALGRETSENTTSIRVLQAKAAGWGAAAGLLAGAIAQALIRVWISGN